MAIRRMMNIEMTVCLVKLEPGTRKTENVLYRLISKKQFLIVSAGKLRAVTDNTAM